MSDESPDPDSAAQRALWNDLARFDPLWAVLAFDDKRNRGWDVREFMKIGEREIALALWRCAELGLPVATGAALDFGCGVGRLTQALARRFDRALGVDISDQMIALARRLNRYDGRASYVRLDTEGLRSLDRDQFDFIYSAMVLQHVPAAPAIDAIREFLRLLRPGGALVFQLASHRLEHSQTRTRPMPDEAYRARLDVTSVLPARLAAGQPLRLDVTVTNTSDVAWIQKDVGSLRVGNHWLDESGDLMVCQDDGRSVMPQVVLPQAAFQADLVVNAPSEPGRYVLEIDVVHEGCSWFAGKGSPTNRRVVPVIAAGAARPMSQVVEFPVPSYDAAELASGPATGGAAAAPPEFPMHGVPRADVIAALRAHGGDIVEIEDDPRAGHDWASYRYFARRER